MPVNLAPSDSDETKNSLETTCVVWQNQWLLCTNVCAPAVWCGWTTGAPILCLTGPSILFKMHDRFLHPKNTEPVPTVFTVLTIPHRVFSQFQKATLSPLSLSVFYYAHGSEMALTQHEFIANKMVSQWFECDERFLPFGSGSDFSACDVFIQQFIRWHGEKGS